MRTSRIESWKHLILSTAIALAACGGSNPPGLGQPASIDGVYRGLLELKSKTCTSDVTTEYNIEWSVKQEGSHVVLTAMPKGTTIEGMTTGSDSFSVAMNENLNGCATATQISLTGITALRADTTMTISAQCPSGSCMATYGGLATHSQN